MKPICILIIFLASCTSPEPIPICSNITYTIDDRGNEYKVHFVIDSNSDKIMYRREDGRESTVVSHYFGCLSMRAVEGEVIVFVDKGMECEVKIEGK